MSLAPDRGSDGSADKDARGGDCEFIGRDINDRNANGKLEVMLSTKKKHYATYLKIVIMDRDTKYAESDIEKIRTFFRERELREFDTRNELDMWLSLEGMLLRNMSGTVTINKLENDFIMEISIPQIGL